MTGADRAIRYSAIGAVSVVALVAAFVSYGHALQVVWAHGESGALALAYPVSAWRPSWLRPPPAFGRRLGG
jgi:hypothetical protein